MFEKIKKFSVAYAACMVVYWLFDGVYMPALIIQFGYWVFLPLYPSILLINFLGLFAYDYFKEDIFFLELGKNWINEEGGSLEWIKRIARKSSKVIFIWLSIWPSPIASYLFIRKNEKEPNIKVLKTMAIGSVFCTAFWGGGMSVLYYLFFLIYEPICNIYFFIFKYF